MTVVELVLGQKVVKTVEFAAAGVHRPGLGPMSDERLLIEVRYGDYSPGPNALCYRASSCVDAHDAAVAAYAGSFCSGEELCYLSHWHE